MTKRPERPKATRLHVPVRGDVHIKQTSRLPAAEKLEKPENKETTGRTEINKQKKAEKVPDGKGVQGAKEIGQVKRDKCFSRDLNRNETREVKTKVNDKVAPDGNANSIPRGFIGRTDMENRLKIKHHDKNVYGDQGVKPTETDKLIKQKGVPKAFVTKSEMDARFRSRKTKTTKVTPIYFETEGDKNTEKSDENNPIVTEHKTVTMKEAHPNPKASKPFSVLENKKKIAYPTGAKTELTAQQSTENNKIEKESEQKPIPKKTLRTKPPQPKQSKAKPYEVGKHVEAETEFQKPKDERSSLNRKQSASTALFDDSASNQTPKHIIATRNTSTAIPKPTNRNIATKNSAGQVSLASVKILIMNTNGKDDKGGSPTERRKNAIQNVVVRHTPHIALFQEFMWTGIAGKTWSKYPFPEHYIYKGHNHASIMYDGNYITVQDLPQSDLDTIMKGLYASSNNQLKKPFPEDFTPMSRMCICRVTASTKPHLDFICISWHGRSNEEGGGRIKGSKKGESERDGGEKKKSERGGGKKKKSERGGGKMKEDRRIEHFEYLMNFSAISEKSTNCQYLSLVILMLTCTVLKAI